MKNRICAAIAVAIVAGAPLVSAFAAASYPPSPEAGSYPSSPAPLPNANTAPPHYVWMQGYERKGIWGNSVLVPEAQAEAETAH